MTGTADGLLDRLRSAPPARRAAYVARLSLAERAHLDRLLAARAATAAASTVRLEPHQTPPAGRWDGWLLLGGRGSGKTWAGVRWLAEQARTRPGLRGRIIAPTLDDAILSCVEGPSGLLTADPTSTYHPSVPGGSVVEWPNGSRVWLRGTPTPRSLDRLRALTNIDVDLFEEAAANPQLAGAVEQASLSRRRAGARWVATTTPQPRATIRGWVDDDTVAVTTATSYDNPHADPGWLDQLERMYAGTRLYRQEVGGELLEDVEGALWRHWHLDRSRVTALPDVPLRYAIGVDPAAGTGTTGIVVVAIDPDGHVYVVEDRSTRGDPSRWAGAVAAALADYPATVVAERDQGGRMVREVLTAAGVTDVPIRPARARSVGSKEVRADAVSILWRKDPPEGHVVGTLPALEDELTSWVPGDPSADSPDRLDAAVWAVLWLRSTAHRPTTVTIPTGTFGGW